jgi:hypothetical protein
MQLATSGDHELAVDKALHRFHGLHPDFEGLGTPCIHPKGGPLTTPQASRDATDRSVAPTNVAFDAGLRPPRFQTKPPTCYRAPWQLPGPDSHRQATTSLRPKINYTRRPPVCWAHERSGLATLSTQRRNTWATDH